MSEKLFLITALTKGEKPKVLFLRNDFVWRDTVSDAITCTLENARQLAKLEPTYCAFVEAKGDLLAALPATKQHSAKKFAKLVKKLNCENSHNRPIKKQPETQAKETSEEQREYVLYRFLGNTDIKQYHYADATKKWCKIGLDTATLYSQKEVEEKIKELLRRDSDGWFCDIYKASEPQPTPAPEAKKRACYVLSRMYKGEKVYKFPAYVPNLVRINGYAAEAHRTREDAQFAADLCNNIWQVEEFLY